jgi:cellulose biosynthesis protein BcsQ
MNNQIITIWGNSGSGKTTTAFKIAKALEEQKKDVMIIMADQVSSVNAFMLEKNLESKSLGKILSSPVITQETILENAMPITKKVSVIGYQDDENEYSYASYTKEKALDFLILSRSVADVIIIDASSNILSSILTSTALEMSDKVIRTCSCDLKGVAFFKSQLPLLVESKYNANNHIRIIANLKDFQPIDSIKEQYQNNIKYILPHSKEIEMQMLKGALLEKSNDKFSKKYENEISKLVTVELIENDINSKTKKKFEKKEKPRYFKFLKKEIVNE